MEDSYILVVIVSIIITIVILVKFFQIASNTKSLNEKVEKLKQISRDINFIKERFDGELNYLSEERSTGELNFLIVNGYKDEAKRMLLRKVWHKKADCTYTELYDKYNPFFIRIEEPFPNEDILYKPSPYEYLL